jgi:hypothetical protein
MMLKRDLRGMKRATEGAEWATVVKGVRLSGCGRAEEQVLSKMSIWWTGRGGLSSAFRYLAVCVSQGNVFYE